MNTTLANNIVKYRKLNGISQKYLAMKVGISSQGLSKIEKGLVSPKVDTIEKILQALCLSPNQLFGLDPIIEDNVDILSRLQKLRG